MSGDIRMSIKETKRITVLEQVKQKLITLTIAASLMDISYRHAKRIWQRYKKKGPASLTHASRGKQSNRRIDPALRKIIVETYLRVYSDFSISLAIEELANENLHVTYSTLRRWLIEEGVWQRKHKYPQHRSRRPRRACFGELVQLDGSFHDWLEDRGPGGCLMNMVDDATGITLAHIEDQETTLGALRLLMLWILKYGIPQAIYCDKKSVYYTDREPTVEEQIAGITPLSKFGKICKTLGIQIITADSPQAKGRVERNHAVYQDRFIKKMRLKNICTVSAANDYLEKEYCDYINSKFAADPSQFTNAHIPFKSKYNMKRVLCVEHIRSVKNDFTVMLDNRVFQIENQKQYPLPKKKITICEYIDSTIHIFDGDRELLFHETDPSPCMRSKKETKKVKSSAA